MEQTARRVTASLDLQDASIARLESHMNTGFSRIGASANASQRLVSSAMGGIKGALAGVSAVALAQSFLKLADESKKLDAQLRLATSGFGSYGQAQEDVARIADETRAGLSETASLYSNFVRGAKELGGSQAEAARATETFSKTLKISGADAGQAASATLQFGQALAAGALRGDELNSILEASPRLARLLADAMGQPIGQIKKLGEEGKLTSDKLLRALTDQKFTAGIDDEFRVLPATFDDAMTKVENAALTTFSAFDRGGQFSTAIANFVTDGADGFGDLESAAERFGIEMREQIDQIVEAARPLLDTLSEIRSALAGIENSVPRSAKISPEGIGTGLDSVTSIWRKPQAFGRGIWSAMNGGTFREGFDNFMNSTSAAALVRQGQANVDAKSAKATMDRIMRGNPLRDAPVKPSTLNVPSTSDEKKKTKPPRSKLNPEAFAREEASLNDQILRLKADELVNASDRAKVELERIEASKQAAIADINADDRYTGEQKKKVIALAETVASLEAARVVYEREVQAAKDALDVRVSSLRNDQDLLRAQSDLADSRQERRGIELRLLDLAYEQEQAELDAIVASKEATEAQKQIARARLAILGRVQEAEAAGIGRQYESPLEQRRREVRRTAANMDDAVENIELNAIDRLTDGLADASTEFVKLGGVAGDVLNSIIRDMIRLAAQQAIFGKAGGGGGLLGSIGGLLGISGARAAGGPVTAGKTYLVGEEGPELFTAPASGTIVPNSMIDTSAARSMTGVSAMPAGVGGVTVLQTIQLHAEGAVMTEDLVHYINAQAQNAAVEGARSGRELAARDLKSMMRPRMG